jgi:hypothetical protein
VARAREALWAKITDEFSNLPSDRPLEIRVRVSSEPGRENWPWVTVLIEGKDLLGVTGFSGFGPQKLLGEPALLLPTEPPRRIAVYYCNCGIPGCGSLAPIIERVGNDIHWRDLRTFTGVYEAPDTDTDPAPERGTPLPIPTLRFDAAQYEAELRRASEDRSWETPALQVSRLVKQQLVDNGRMAAHPNAWLQVFAPHNDGWTVFFLIAEDGRSRQVSKAFPGRTGDPASVAEKLVEEVLKFLDRTHNGI